MERFGTTFDSTLAYEADCGSFWCQFGITLGRVGVALTSLWCHLGVALGCLWEDFWIILGSLCSCFAYAGPFSKTFISLCFFMTFNGSGVNSEPLWGHFEWLWVTLGSFLAYEAEFESL